jgi:glycosyltransferase involved in cell wall biosynthesis
MISIIMPIFNDEKFTKDALDSIMAQTYKNFELIIIEDHSTDNSPKIISLFKDKRIKVYVNEINLGIAKSRNKALKIAKGDYIFFTDSDCIADKDWLKEGIKTFNTYKCLGVEGLTYYVKKGYKPSISDKFPGTAETPGIYLGCNIAYTKDIMMKLHGYDERYHYHDDREFAIRVKKCGKIVHCDKMIITHQNKSWDCKSYIKACTRVRDWILLFKEHHDTTFMTGRILFPRGLIKIFFPPLIFVPLFKHKNNTLLDYRLVLCSYVKFVYERIYIWKTAFKERVFII